ncbi:MAG: GWxTD domain-containing protein [Methanosarcinaceae archaeon]
MKKKIYKNLNLTGKQNFFIEFWARRNPDSLTPENELETGYNKLLEYAEKNFRSSLRKGWKSDRGRVLLVYGLPNTKEVTQATMETKAYEIWEYYDIDGGVIFVFVDRKRSGAFDLVHSIKRGEISQYDWKVHYARP